MNLLQGKTAIITGGTSGIGKAIAIEFAKNGANVVIFGTNEERAKAVVEEIKKAQAQTNQEATYVLVDISQSIPVKEAISRILEHFGSIEILVNNAGITRDNLLMKMTEEEWDSVVDVNLKSVYNTCSTLIRPMMKARAGKIINITSVIGLTGNSGQVNYAASKSGMIGFTKSLAKEVASRNICVNCIAPGYIKTPMTEDLPEAIKSSILKQIPQQRIGNAQDIANAALFLSSDLSKYITGQVLTVDGGMVM